MLCHIHLGSDTSWTRGTVRAWGLEPGASLIFPGAYLPSSSSASADWYTLLLVLHNSNSSITCLITGSKCSLSCTPVIPEICTDAHEDCFANISLPLCDDEDVILSPQSWKCVNAILAFFSAVDRKFDGMTARFFPHISVFFSVRISKAADFKDHNIQVASCLISLKVEPSPALSSSLLGGPLIKIVLTHMLVSLTHGMSQFPWTPFVCWENNSKSF